MGIISNFCNLKSGEIFHRGTSNSGSYIGTADGWPVTAWQHWFAADALTCEVTPFPQEPLRSLSSRAKKSLERWELTWWTSTVGVMKTPGPRRLRAAALPRRTARRLRQRSRCSPQRLQPRGAQPAPGGPYSPAGASTPPRHRPLVAPPPRARHLRTHRRRYRQRLVANHPARTSAPPPRPRPLHPAAPWQLLCPQRESPTAALSLPPQRWKPAGTRCPPKSRWDFLIIADVTILFSLQTRRWFDHCTSFNPLAHLGHDPQF